MRLGLAVLVLLLAAGRVEAVEYSLLQWKKDQQCEVVVSLPFFGSHYSRLGIYPSRWEAERALEDSRRRHKCPPPPQAERGGKKPPRD